MLNAGSKLAFAGLFLVNSFYPSPTLQNLMVLCLACMAVFSFALVKRVNKVVSATLFAVGAAVFIYAGAGFPQWRAGALENAGIIVMVLMTPLLAVCVQFYDFEQDIRIFAAKWVRSGISFYTLLVVISFLISLLLNLAALPLLYYIFDTLRKNYSERILYGALTRGYFINAVWSPNYISIAVVINYLGVRWGDLAGWGLLFTAIALLMSIVLEWLRLRRGGGADPGVSFDPADVDSDRDYRKGLGWLGFVIVLVMAGILSLEKATGKGIMVVVPIISISLPFLLAAALGRWKKLKDRLNGYGRVTLPGINSEVFLFLSAGFLACAFKSVDLGTVIVDALNNLGVNSAFPLIVVLTAFIGLPPLIGVHPIITISAVASIYASGGLAISQLQLALTMLVGYHMYAVWSPFSSGILVLANLTQKSTLYLGLKINGLYELCISLVFILIIALL